jgi:GT2 family glycosyltransferase
LSGEGTDVGRRVSEAPRARFQLVVTTIGRAAELDRLLDSIRKQTEQDVHVLVVDQSAGRDVAALCDRYSGVLAIDHVRTGPGASKGRNAGIAGISPLLDGERIVAFPDDDCSYPSTLLAEVRDLLDANRDWAGLTGRSIDEDGAPSTGRWDREAGVVTRANVWRRGVAFTIFLRESAVARVGLFEESLGPGAGTNYGAGEETDYLLRALSKGLTLFYDPALVVRHPGKLGRLDAEAFAKSRRYGMGMGRVLRTHRYRPPFIVYACVRPLGGAAVAVLRGRPARARYHWEMFVGRLLGVRSTGGHDD